MIRSYDPHRAPDSVIGLDQAETLTFVAAQTGAALATFEDVTLSQNWRQDAPFGDRAPAGLVSGIYTLSFAMATAPVGPQSILIPRVARTVDIALNGTAVYSEAALDAQQSWDWYTPRLIDLPDGLIRQGANRLTVTVTASFRSTAGLSRILLGPRAAVAPIAKRINLLQTQLPLVANLATLVMAVPLLLVWAHGRGATVRRYFSPYGFLAVAMIIFALRSLHVHAGEAPISMAIWLPLVSASLAWAVGCFAVFLLRQSGTIWRWPERGIIGFVLAGSAVLFLLPQSYFAEHRTLLFYVPLSIAGITCIGYVCVRTILQPNRSQILLSLALLMIVPPVINDLAWLRGGLPFETILWLPLAVPTVLLAISATVADNYARSWVRAQEANAELNRRIAAAHDELRQSFEARIVAERRETIASERAQLIADLHDGVGNRLSILLATFRAQGLPGVRSLQDCLNDLRIVMTARDVGTMHDALADLWHLNRSAAEVLEITITFDCAETLRDLHLPPKQMLDILRIGQEALSNALRHSGGDQITLQAGLGSAGDFFLRISDNGAPDPQAARLGKTGGRGLATMRSRAARLGGAVDITQDAGGWCVEFILPRSKARPAATERIAKVGAVQDLTFAGPNHGL